MTVQVSHTIAMKRFMEAHPDVAYAEHDGHGFRLIITEITGAGVSRYEGHGPTMEAAYAVAGGAA